MNTGDNKRKASTADLTSVTPVKQRVVPDSTVSIKITPKQRDELMKEFQLKNAAFTNQELKTRVSTTNNTRANAIGLVTEVMYKQTQTKLTTLHKYMYKLLLLNIDCGNEDDKLQMYGPDCDLKTFDDAKMDFNWARNGFAIDRVYLTFFFKKNMRNIIFINTNTIIR